jgi:hypothetical protein
MRKSESVIVNYDVTGFAGGWGNVSLSRQKFTILTTPVTDLPNFWKNCALNFLPRLVPLTSVPKSPTMR